MNAYKRHVFPPNIISTPANLFWFNGSGHFNKKQ